MNRYSFTMNGYTFTRISRTKARAAYNNGLTVILCPCKLRPGTPWHFETFINRKADEDTFEAVTNCFEGWNCNLRETGRYTSFYIPVRTVDRFTGEPCPADRPGAVEQYDYNFMKGGKERA